MTFLEWCLLAYGVVITVLFVLSDAAHSDRKARR